MSYGWVLSRIEGTEKGLVILCVWCSFYDKQAKVFLVSFEGDSSIFFESQILSKILHVTASDYLPDKQHSFSQRWYDGMIII